MDIARDQIWDRCTEAVFGRGQIYCAEGRIQRRDQFGSLVTATVQGSRFYEVTVDFAGEAISTTCTCPYTGPGDCKHVVAVLLDIIENPPADRFRRARSTRAALATYRATRQRCRGRAGQISHRVRASRSIP